MPKRQLERDSSSHREAEDVGGGHSDRVHELGEARKVTDPASVAAMAARAPIACSLTTGGQLHASRFATGGPAVSGFFKVPGVTANA